MKNYGCLGILIALAVLPVKADNELWCYRDQERSESQLSIYNASNKDLEIIDTNKEPAGTILIKAGTTFYYYKTCRFYSNYPRLFCEDTGISFIHPITKEKIVFDPRDKEFLSKLVLGTFDHATRTIKVNDPIKKVFSVQLEAVEEKDGKLQPTFELYNENGQKPGSFFGCGKKVHYVIDVNYKIARVENDVTMSLP